MKRLARTRIIMVLVFVNPEIYMGVNNLKLSPTRKNILIKPIHF